MSISPEVLIIGAGPAGISAALRLARAGMRVLVLEGAEYAGAENWSGSVYHADSLLRDDVLGRKLWAEAPKERRIVARSLFVHDGIHAAGFEARAHKDNDYGEAWTVLRPKIDRWLAARAIDFGVTLLPGTTVTGLRYDGERVVGVETERGPIDAQVVFIAEGDAAGLLARENLERQAQPHYAQGIKAVFRLPAQEIERRFGVKPGEGVAQEWVLRNGQVDGRRVALNLTGFLYTNHDTLSVGAVLPLGHLAKGSVADHPHLLKRFLQTPVIAEYLKDAQQVAYGAKVIRSGGVNETPEWVRPGLAVGGGALGMGQEIPYPNFIAPAITSALTFADGVLAMRNRRADYTRENLQKDYVAALKESDDYANAELIRAWPAAIHGGPLLFEHLPTLLGHFVEAGSLPKAEAAAERRRAIAKQLSQWRTDMGQALKLSHGMGPRLKAPAKTLPPLTVRFLISRAGQLPEEIDARHDALLKVMAFAIGHFYARRLPAFHDRLALIWRGLGRMPWALLRLGGFGLQGAVGGLQLWADQLRQRWSGQSRQEFLQQAYYRHTADTQGRLDWSQARRQAASPVAWIAPMGRFQPDPRHLTIPLNLGDMAQQLRNVCPAEVYTVVSRLGGVSSQHENCIKCESCRVTVPGIDWNRTTGHRLTYRVPGDGRYGFDASVKSTLRLPDPSPLTLGEIEKGFWQKLYTSLRARPAMTGSEWPQAWKRLLQEIPVSENLRAVHTRLQAWLNRSAYGWMESEVRALLERAQALPQDTDAVREPAAHAHDKRLHQWQSLRRDFGPERLRLLADAPWREADRKQLLQWLDAARPYREQAVEWLATWSNALAWLAANHYLAEARVGRAIVDYLSAPVWREQDGFSNWLPAPAQQFIDARGQALPHGQVLAHGTGGDAAQPIRMTLDPGLAGFSASPEMAQLSLAIALGQAQVLRQRATEYAGQRVQFRGGVQDVEGRDAIAKFGRIKHMLANIDYVYRSLYMAQSWCTREPSKVLALIRRLMGPWLDGLPWLAGQIFGGMAFSEEDILAPRYRDAMLLSQWPGSRELQTEETDISYQVLQAGVKKSGLEYTWAKNLMLYADGRRRQLVVRPPQSPIGPAHPAKGKQPLTWDEKKKFIYQSGGFFNGRLLKPEHLLTPEHYRRDARLRQARAQVQRFLHRRIKSPNPGQHYGHYLDEQHRIPHADIQKLRDFNAFASIVPANLGGLGWNKAQYSILTNATMGELDASFGLLIMANTSIGTMPVLLGREKEIPKIEQELNTCIGNAYAWQQLRAGLQQLLSLHAHGDVEAVQKAMQAWSQTLKGLLLYPGSSVKYLARAYTALAQRTLKTALRGDMHALGKSLQACSSGLGALQASLQQELSELPARKQAHDRYLRFLASGQISAFALTEPAAGSDTGSIQTRSVWREVPAQDDGQGFYRFIPHGSKEARVVLDATRLVFEDRKIRYRMADGSLGDLDDSDWDMQANRGRRHIRAAGRVYKFDDIGTLVEVNGKSLYRYWELSGNKMWITNGSVADRYCLYTQSERGEIAFMVERRSEGLRIGPDENKLGQRASATNELTLDRVRVSADQIIGYIGHGQVNALETLSVGRGGLVMCCATIAQRLLRDYPEDWKKDPALHAIAQAEVDRLQTLAARLVGLMDRSDLMHGDFRIEAAFSKYLASEGAHRVLGWLETLQGPQAAAREGMLEKIRRDIRVINIYEGTNEIQRFLVMKELPNLLRDAHPQRVDNEQLENALQSFRDFAGPRVQKLGASLASNPDLQARWFTVVDWAAELYSWCCLHERMRFLETQKNPADTETLLRLRTTEASIAQYVQDLAAVIRADFAAAEQGGAHPADASLLLARTLLNTNEPEKSGPYAVGALSGDWGVVLRSRVELNAHGLVWAGWHTADLAVLERLLSWADVAPQLKIKLAVIAPAGVEDQLRRLQATGVNLIHLVQPVGVADGVAAASAIQAYWPEVTRWACGRRAGQAQDISFCAQLTQQLGVEVMEDAVAVGAQRRGHWVEDAEWQRHYLAAARPIGLLWDIKPNGRSQRYSAQAWLAAMDQDLPVVESAALSAPLNARPLPPSVTADLPERFASPQELADWLKRRFGEAAQPEPSASLKETQSTLKTSRIWLAPAANLSQVRRRAGLRLLGDLAGEFGVLVWHPANETWPGVSRFIQQAGLRGLWQLPIQGTTNTPALATNLVKLLSGVQQLILEAEQRDLGAALATQLGLPLFDQVRRVDGKHVTCDLGGYLVDIPLPAAAVFIAATDYQEAPLSEPAVASLPVSRLPAARPVLRALGRWRARVAGQGEGLAAAPVIVDVGMGISNEAVYKALVPSLQQALANLSGMPVEIGATRKITQELKLLPADRQIGQTGIGVSPELLFALGISGAPQHMNWVDTKSVVIAINRDQDAPIFSWHRQNPGPQVIACVGDLNDWIPALVQALNVQSHSTAAAVAGA